MIFSSFFLVFKSNISRSIDRNLYVNFLNNNSKNLYLFYCFNLLGDSVNAFFGLRLKISSRINNSAIKIRQMKGEVFFSSGSCQRDVNSEEKLIFRAAKFPSSVSERTNVM